MNIILLSGGSGQRLWPLSNDIRSKQFIKIFKDQNDEYESMLQRTLRQIRNIDKNVSITVATSKNQETILKKYIDSDVKISTEPCRRNTFPSIALAASYLHDIQKISSDEPVVISPVDPYVDNDFFATFKHLIEQISDDFPLVLMGIEPTYPSEKYGYIIPESAEQVSKVKTFKEKPNLKTAQKYIEFGALWNGGVFALKIGYVLDKAKELLGYCTYSELLNNYDSLKSISFDYAVVEHEENIKVVRYNGEWKDVGTWNTLTEVMDSNYIGKVQVNETCDNLHVINESDLPIICMGLKDIVVAASPEGILVSDKKSSSYIKPFVENIHQQIRFAEKSWGSFQVIDIGNENLTVKVTLNPGHKMNYHSHKFRREIWNVIEGKGRVIIDNVKTPVKVGDIIELPIGCKHTVIADSTMKIIEVQIGKDIDVEDKEIFELKLGENIK